MLYRFALGLGLVLLGAYVSRELSRTKPVRTAIKNTRPMRLERPSAPARSKVYLH